MTFDDPDLYDAVSSAPDEALDQLDFGVTNNFMVAHRFENEQQLDATIDYVFTLRMTPTPVRPRLLRHPGAERQFLLVQRS